MKVHAVDKDKGPNRKVSYDFVYSAEETFSIDKKTGIIRLNRKLDRERVGYYNLTVKATDHGFPQLSSVAAVHVQVQDINDNPPVFSQKHYRVLVSEKEDIGAKVIQVFAVSIDIGSNAEITYSLLAGNDLGYFKINDKTGSISVIKHLDYEDIRNFVLIVEAKDGGTPPLTAQATVNVSVVDANDNTPIFNQASYHAIIREDASLGHAIIQVKATDVDSAPNAFLSYFITKGDRFGQFYIDKEKGYIKLASSLDREKVSKYVLEVECRDSGAPYLFNKVIVYVEVADVNDNPPIFSKLNYTATLKEDKQSGFPIVSFRVTDEDIAPNTGPFVFSIISGNENSSFQILPQENVLRTAKKLSHHSRNNYTLCVQVSDAGLPPLSSQAWVTVLIVKEGRFAPTIIPLQITVTSFGARFPGGVLGRVRATDEDPYDTLTFDIVSSHKELFQINHENGTITALPGLDPGEYSINISVTDDKFTSINTITIQNNVLTEEAVKHSVIVRIADVSPERFIQLYPEAFLEFLRIIFHVPLKNVQIISIQRVKTIFSQRSTESHADLDVLFCVRKSPSSFHPSDLIRSELKEKVKSFQTDVGLEIQEIMADRCSSETCEKGDCVDKVQMDDRNIQVISVDTRSFVSHRFHRVFNCHCESGYGGSRCERILNECARRPCSSQKVCIPTMSALGYVCECPRGKTGILCEDESSICKGPFCYEEKNSISFGGRSFAQYSLNGPVEHHFAVYLHVRTVQTTGNLMFAAGRKDYSILEMVNGVAQYKMDFGSGEGIVRVEDIKLNDGTWHEVKVDRRGSRATITIDGQAEETGAAPGVHDLLNLDGNDVYFGAEVRSLRYDDVRMGFIGCMDDIRINGVELPLHVNGTDNIPNLRRFVNVEFHCGELIDPGICGKQPCLHGGTCKDNEDSFTCLCSARYLGIQCEIDTDPCASNPCLYGGTCSNYTNGYQCKCLPGYSGKRCGYGHFCNPNPCSNGGICEEGTYGPVCKCRGFHGDRCQLDLDECQAEPCGDGATCINFHGTFQCQCQPNVTGPLCTEPLFTSSITSTSMNTTLEEIIGIVLMIMFLLITSIGLVCCCKRYHRKCRRIQRNENLQEDSTANELVVKNSMFHRDDSKHITKLCHLEDTSFTRPAVPPRPKVYTPTIQEPYHNLINVRSYEQVAENLDTFPRYSTDFPRIIKQPQTIRNLPSTSNLKLSRTSSVSSNNTNAEEGLEERVQNDNCELKNEENLHHDFDMDKLYSGTTVCTHQCISSTSPLEGVVRSPDGEIQLVPNIEGHYHSHSDHNYEQLKCDNSEIQTENERTIALQPCHGVEFYADVTYNNKQCTVAPSLEHSKDDVCKDSPPRMCQIRCNRESCACVKESVSDLSDDDIVSYGFPSQGGRGFMLELA